MENSVSPIKYDMSSVGICSYEEYKANLKAIIDWKDKKEKRAGVGVTENGEEIEKTNERMRMYAEYVKEEAFRKRLYHTVVNDLIKYKGVKFDIF